MGIRFVEKNVEIIHVPQNHLKKVERFFNVLRNR